MKLNRIANFSFALVALILWGCAKQTPEPPKQVEVEADGRRVFYVRGGDTMRFDQTRIEVTAGEAFSIVFINTGRMSKEHMGHNLLILQRDANARAYTTAAAAARDEEYMPAALADQVLATTRMLGPGESDRLDLVAPEEPGDYVYVCSFPAHYAAGMKGVLVVKPRGEET